MIIRIIFCRQERMIENYLSLMAKQGYIFKKIRFSDYYVFKRNEPENTRYFIDYRKVNNSDDLYEYCKERLSQGLKLVYSKDNMHIFKGKPGKIQRDNDSCSLKKQKITESYEFIKNMLHSASVLLMALSTRYYNHGNVESLTLLSVFLLVVTILNIIKFREYKLIKKVLAGNRVKTKVIITNTETTILLIIMYILYGIFR